MSSELKTQFLNYMTLQRFSDHTKRSYVTGVKLVPVQKSGKLRFDFPKKLVFLWQQP
jgi:hypothetical protein